MAGITENPKMFPNNIDSERIILLDGGTGEELFVRGVPDDRKIWSAKAVVDSQYHETLKDVHKSYLHAGSTMITTNSYGITPGVGFQPEEIRTFVYEAGRLAREAVEEFEKETNQLESTGEKKYVCGSLGPLKESYRPDLILEHSAGRSIYELMIHALYPNIDVLLAETMSSTDEASQALDALSNTKKNVPIMISFCLNSKGCVRSGESVTSAIERIMRFAKDKGVRLFAILFNCSQPEAISSALNSIHSNEELLDQMKRDKINLGAYANKLTSIQEDWSMETSTQPQAMRYDLSPRDYYERFVMHWTKHCHTTIIGGCCGITPKHIEYLNEQLHQNK